jgi:formate dehydrogenase iron-sulfur subunit
MTQMTTNAGEFAPGWLVSRLLEEQQSLTAVDRFAQLHEHGAASAGAKYYRDLIPAGPPGQGEQYAFEVDLDACSGCKACVTACHNLNGLEEDELWRNVGVLVGGTSQSPLVQHVTLACHHCLEPACLEGCPVEAYEKHPQTGIVRHLDDQCIGCQYCMLKCPYDVPVYSKSKGIVRKCDMCHHRLAAGEAPACVQACPNQAIRVRVVGKEAVREESEAHPFLPGAPDPSYTHPTTHYKTRRAMPRNTLPADYFAVQRAHGHIPLVVMLVLTQMSVGAFVVEQAMHLYFAAFRAEIAGAAGPWHVVAALLLGMLGLAASIFHLGRPLYAYRALLGLRTSWLSREILAFAVFAAATTAYAAVACLNGLGGMVPTSWQSGLGSAAAAAGLLAVFCSVMIYVDTRRPLWTPFSTAAKFLLTAAVLGIPTALLVSLATAAITDDLTVRAVMLEYGRTLCGVLLAVAAVKLLLELCIFAHLRQTQHTPRKRTALLLSGELSMVALRRFFFGAVGGIGLPLLLLGEPVLASGSFHPLFIGVATTLMLGLLTAGELHERYLFFAASVAPKMPGAPAA